MDSPGLTALLDRLRARLGDCSLTRFQLIDMATVLMLMQCNIDRGIDVRDRATVNALNTPLHLMRDHGQDAPVDELRCHVATAARATAHILSPSTGESYPESPHLLGQERAYA